MNFEDIKAEWLQEMYTSTKYNSMTIESDAESALSNSSNDEEFLQNWRASLHTLIEECQGVLKDLEPSKEGVTEDAS